MAKPITYNQVLEILEDLANRHLQINYFGHGMIEDVNTFQQDDDKFPVLWVVPQSSKVTENALVYRLRLLVFDIDKTSDDYRTEILSDTLLIMNDIILALKHNDEDHMVLGEPNCIPFVQKFVDYCAGWYCDIELETTINNNPCAFVE